VLHRGTLPHPVKQRTRAVSAILSGVEDSCYRHCGARAMASAPSQTAHPAAAASPWPAPDPPPHHGRRTRSLPPPRHGRRLRGAPPPPWLCRARIPRGARARAGDAPRRLTRDAPRRIWGRRQPTLAAREGGVRRAVRWPGRQRPAAQAEGVGAAPELRRLTCSPGRVGRLEQRGSRGRAA